MDSYDSLEGYNDNEIRHALSLMKRMGCAPENTTGYSSDCSCSGCEGDTTDCCEFLSATDDDDDDYCSCSDCCESNAEAVCYLAPRGTTKAKKKRATVQYDCSGGVCKRVTKKPTKAAEKKRKPAANKKNAGKSKKANKKTPKKRARGKKCCCCSDYH